uniref:plasmid SOS inhibition protein A n=1 Tax=Salmonella enterica TaxID=28901 RepID=UPI001445BA55|nr:plasmid SOS inhibition protein A [Salmonella enterica]
MRAAVQRRQPFPGIFRWSASVRNGRRCRLAIIDGDRIRASGKYRENPYARAFLRHYTGSSRISSRALNSVIGIIWRPGRTTTPRRF